MTDGWKPSRETLEALEILEKFHEERKRNPVEQISLPPGQDFLIGYDSKGRKLYVDDEKEEASAGEFARRRSASDRPSGAASATAVSYRDRVLGSLLAGAVGDALGAPIEGLPMDNIRQLYGPEGIVEFKPAFGVGPGLITDDTQMTLFTLEGLIRAHLKQRNLGTADVPAVVHRAYLRWLRTQTPPPPQTEPSYLPDDGWLITNRALHRRRAPGKTCMTALRASRDGEPFGTFEHRLNDSKGNGGVMRAAPVALWPGDVHEVFELAARTAAVTHSHPSGYLSAGTLAVIVRQVLHGASLPDAIQTARTELVRWPNHEEQLVALDAGVALAAEGRPTPETLYDRLGYGGVGEQAVSIAVCCALSARDVEDGIRLAVNHSGDSDSTGSLCGNILGARYGVQAIPQPWLDQLELRDVIETIALDALTEFGPEPPRSNDWYARYPSGDDKEQPAQQSIARAVPTGLTRDERFVGSILAGAVGDALGYTVEFESIDGIRRRYGGTGITDFDRRSGRGGEISDDTQMTLFTLEGLIRAHVRRRLAGSDDVLLAVQHAYQRWLHTQGNQWANAAGMFGGHAPAPDGWLISNQGLFATRAPGNTCITALRAFARSGQMGTFSHRLNDSKGCGGVMRAAPAALWSEDPAEVFQLGAATAALTHSHPSGYLSAGTLAVIVHRLLAGADLRAAVDTARSLLVRWDGHEEQTRALDTAVELAATGRPTPEQIAERLGGGWVGEEALAIGVCAALCTDNLADALIVAVNHSGDSDSTGAVCGNIVGAHYGPAAIPSSWLDTLELREIIDTIAHDALREFGPQPPSTPDWYRRYPGW